MKKIELVKLKHDCCWVCTYHNKALSKCFANDYKNGFDYKIHETSTILNSAQYAIKYPTIAYPHGTICKGNFKRRDK